MLVRCEDCGRVWDARPGERSEVLRCGGRWIATVAAIEACLPQFLVALHRPARVAEVVR